MGLPKMRILISVLVASIITANEQGGVKITTKDRKARLVEPNCMQGPNPDILILSSDPGQIIHETEFTKVIRKRSI